MKDIFYEASKDTANGIYVKVQNAGLCRMHFHRAFEIAYLTNGSSRYTLEDNEFTAYADHIFFSHCYYRHRSTDAANLSRIVIGIPENLSDDISLLLKNSTLPAIMTDTEFNKSLLPYFRALSRSDESTALITVKGYLNLIFGSLSAHYGSVEIVKKNKNVSVIVDILNYIDLHCTEHLALDSLSQVFGYNKSYFSRLFNNHVGISLNNYINLARLNRYEQLSRNTDGENVTALIYQAGFQSVSTFYRIKALREKTEK